MATAFYLDENVALELETTLRSHGHVVTSTHDERRKSATDGSQLLYAGLRNWVVLTHNRKDFYLLHDAWLLWRHHWRVRETHAGIIVMEQPLGLPNSDLAEIVPRYVTTRTEPLTGVLVSWRRGMGWEPFPDGWH